MLIELLVKNAPVCCSKSNVALSPYIVYTFTDLACSR